MLLGFNGSYWFVLGWYCVRLFSAGLMTGFDPVPLMGRMKGDGERPCAT